MAAVSDVAAMGGDAGVAVVTVAGPPGTDLARLYEGLGAAAAAQQVPDRRRGPEPTPATWS